MLKQLKSLLTPWPIIAAVLLITAFVVAIQRYIYGLGAMGQAGVTRALEIIHMELDKTMALCGRRKVTELNRENLLIPEDFRGRFEKP